MVSFLSNLELRCGSKEFKKLNARLRQGSSRRSLQDMTKFLRSLLWSFVLMLAMILCWIGFYWALKALWWGINIFNWFNLFWINFLTEWIPGVGSGFLGGYAAMAILETRIRGIYAAALRIFPYILWASPLGCYCFPSSRSARKVI